MKLLKLTTETCKFLGNIKKESSISWQGISAKKWEEYYKTMLMENSKEF